MARKTAELQRSAVRGDLRRVRADFCFADRVREVDERRSENRAVFGAIGLRPA